MAKKPQRKHLTTILLLTLLSSCMYAALIPNANAAEITIEQKGLTVASDVVGIDLAKYAIISQKYQPDFYMDTVPQENMRYRLESDTSKIDMLYTFANGKLRMIHVLETEGTPDMSKSVANEFEMAKTFSATTKVSPITPFTGK